VDTASTVAGKKGELMERILILGCSGMLGSAMYRFFASQSDHVISGTVRSHQAIAALGCNNTSGIIDGVDVGDLDSLIGAFARARPTVVINCVGLVKQLGQSTDPLNALPINSLLPHRLARLCAAAGARLVHISTDCVFSGKIGGYRESDFADADDLYGRSKYLGEVSYSNTVTLRTSIVGHELNSAHGLINWFLSQTGSVKGFRRAVFSGLPTVALAEVIRDHVLPDSSLAGVYHVSSAPINKYDLLKMVAEIYQRSTVIVPDDSLVIDRSLDSTLFRQRTGYQSADWQTMVRQMHSFA
jgi:dTDP-4-dehydrorhamnose reductase